MILSRTLTPTACAVLLAACGGSDRIVDVQEARAVKRPAPRLDATSAERFAPPRSESAPMGGSQSGAEPFAYALPQGWAKLSRVPMRDINLTAPGEVQCWVSVLPPSSTALAHLARWHGQLGLPAPDATAIDALPRVPLLGGEAMRVDLRAADGTKRLIASMLLAPARQVFVRMEGAPDAVEAQLAALRRFEESLREAPVVAGGDGSDEPEPAFGWTVPPTWKAVTPGPMMLQQFDLGDEVKCWLTLLRGDGGGTENNIARWCGFAGKAPLGSDEIEALERWDVLGARAIYVPLLGDDGKPGLVGIMIPLATHTLYVRMSGSSGALKGRLEAFKTFCTSLERRT